MKLRLALAVLLASGGSAMATNWPAADSFMNASLVCSNHPQPRSCEFGMASFPDDYSKATKGDYQAQKNVAYCFETGCDWAVNENKMMACAWHIVVMGSGHQQTDDLDRRYAETACKKLDHTGRITAERQATAMLQLLGVE